MQQQGCDLEQSEGEASGRNPGGIVESFKYTLSEARAGAFAIIAATAVLVNAANFVFVIIVARLLGPSDYSALASLMAVATVVTIGICGPFQTIIARYVSTDTAIGEDDNARFLVSRATIAGTISGAGLALLIAVLCLPLKGWLRIESITPLFLLAIYVFIGFMQPAFAGAVQGLQRFKVFGTALVAGAVLLVVVGSTLVAAGMKLTGAMIAEVVSAFITVFILAIWVKRWMSRGRPSGRFNLGHLKRFAPAVIATSTCMAAFLYMDVFLVRGLIGGPAAGYYTAAQKLGSVVYLIPGVFGLVLFPRVSANKARGVSSWSLLLRVVAILATLCTIATVLLIAFPEMFLDLVFGRKYSAGSQLVPILAVAGLCYSLVSIGAVYLLATDKLGFVCVLFSGVLLELLGILVFHNSVMSVAVIVVTVAAAMLALLYGYLAALYLRRDNLVSDVA